MKSIVRSDTLTTKTVEIMKGRTQFQLGSFLGSSFTTSTGLLSLLTGNEALGVILLGGTALLSFISFRKHDVQDLVNVFTGKNYSWKELAGMVKDGERVPLGEPRFIKSKRTLSKKEPSELEYVTYETGSYEIKTYLKRTGKKLSIEQVATELPLVTWEQAFHLLLEKDRIVPYSLESIVVDPASRYHNKTPEGKAEILKELSE
jgi:hypothetical protein